MMLLEMIISHLIMFVHRPHEETLTKLVENNDHFRQSVMDNSKILQKNIDHYLLNEDIGSTIKNEDNTYNCLLSLSADASRKGKCVNGQELHTTYVGMKRIAFENPNSPLLLIVLSLVKIILIILNI